MREGNREAESGFPAPHLSNFLSSRRGPREKERPEGEGKGKAQIPYVEVHRDKCIHNTHIVGKTFLFSIS